MHPADGELFQSEALSVLTLISTFLANMPELKATTYINYVFVTRLQIVALV